MPAAFEITMSMKRFFLDSPEVVRQLDRANRRAMSRVGAFIRRRARSSLRRRKRTSEAGETPSVHSTDKVASLKNILFFYDPGQQTLVVGPVKLGGRKRRFGAQLGSATVPQVLEFGGTVAVREVRVGKSWLTGVRRAKRGQPVRTRRARYQSRPFMGPALEREAEAGTIPKAWSGSVRG